MTRRGITPTDKLVLGYLLVNSTFVAWRAAALTAWPFLLLANALTALLVLLFAREDGERPLVAILGGAYPVLLTVAFYSQLGVLGVGVGHFHDPLVQGWEAALFGSQVAVTWHRAQPSAALSWLMHLAYWAYYPIVVGALVALWRGTSREAYVRGGFIVTLGFYACYLAFALFPVMGPRHYFGDATGTIAEVLPARLMRAAQHGASAMGTAFPSSHVAAGWCAVYALWRDRRALATALAPVALLMALGTVYGQFHYGVDALAGAVVAVLLCLVADPLRTALGPGGSPS